MCADFNTCMPIWLGYANMSRDVVSVDLLTDALFPGVRTKSMHALTKRGRYRMVELHWLTRDVSLVVDGYHLFRVIFPLAKSRVMLDFLAFLGCSWCLLALKAQKLRLERSPERLLRYSKHLKASLNFFQR